MIPLNLDKTWFHDRRLFTVWHPSSRIVLQQTRNCLYSELHSSLHRACVHLKGRGGVKGALRYIMQQQGSHHYVARFDVARYYESIDHEVLLMILRQRWASSASEAVVADYLRLSDWHRSGRGMTAGGSLSPLLAAVMLIPLDEAMKRLRGRYGLFYVRYMDDFVIMTTTRHRLRQVIKEVHSVMKRFWGKVHSVMKRMGLRLHLACHPRFNWLNTYHSPITSCNILLILAYIWGYYWGYKYIISTI